MSTKQKKENTLAYTLQKKDLQMWVLEGYPTRKIFNLFWEKYGKENFGRGTLEKKLMIARQELKDRADNLLEDLNKKIDGVFEKRAKNAERVLGIINQIDLELLEEFQKSIKEHKKKGSSNMPVLEVFEVFKNSKVDLSEIYPRARLEAGQVTSSDKKDITFNTKVEFVDYESTSDD